MVIVPHMSHSEKQMTRQADEMMNRKVRTTYTIYSANPLTGEGDGIAAGVKPVGKPHSWFCSASTAAAHLWEAQFQETMKRRAVFVIAQDSDSDAPRVARVMTHGPDRSPNAYRENKQNRQKQNGLPRWAAKRISSRVAALSLF